MLSKRSLLFCVVIDHSMECLPSQRIKIVITLLGCHKIVWVCNPGWEAVDRLDWKANRGCVPHVYCSFQSINQDAARVSSDVG